MINYTKRVVIFKEITPNYTLNNKAFRGSCLIENKENLTTFYFDFLCPIKPGLTIYICGDNENITSLIAPNKERFLLSFNDFYVKNGVNIAVFDNETLIFNGKSGDSFYDINYISEYVKKLKRIEKESKTNIRKIEKYDDETIATENYYKLDNEKQSLHSENVNEFVHYSQKQQNEKDATKLREYEKNIRPFEAWDFYGKIKNSLEGIFNNYPICNNFDQIFPDSKFVKIHYADNKFYYVGKIFEGGVLKYICYGVEGYYNNNFNDNISNFTFIPKSKFNRLGDGYYVIFQNVDNGEFSK